MIRTNSKQARQNVQAYIMEHFDGCNYEIEPPGGLKAQTGTEPV